MENDEEYMFLICFDIFSDKNNGFVRLTGCNCNTVYHYVCLDTWLKRSSTCPMCRKEVQVDDKIDWDCVYVCAIMIIILVVFFVITFDI